MRIKSLLCFITEASSVIIFALGFIIGFDVFALLALGFLPVVPAFLLGVAGGVCGGLVGMYGLFYTDYSTLQGYYDTQINAGVSIRTRLGGSGPNPYIV